MERPATHPLASRDEGGARAAEMLPLVYAELQELANARLHREAPGNTLQATALVHEAYLRLQGANGNEPQWESQAHFFRAATETMRRILIDRARARSAVKRGGGARRLTLESAILSADDRQPEILEADEALERLAAHDAP